MRSALSRLQDRIGLAADGHIVRSIATLVGGTAVGHMITAAAMPVATRLYAPADFSVAAAFASLVGILTAVSCLRFDMAIALPEDEADGASLLVLALAAAFAFALAVGAVVAIEPRVVTDAARSVGLETYLWFLPFATLLSGAYLALQMWAARRKSFGAISRSRIAQSSLAAGAQLGLGALGRGPVGLVIAQLCNYGTGAIWLLAGAIRKDRGKLGEVNLARIAAAARRYRNFPLYSTWEALANAASIQLPILMIAALAIGPEAGYLSLAIFVLQIPMALMGQSVAQVYVSGAASADREGELGRFTEKFVVGLVKGAAGPIGLLAGFAPAAFAVIFGSGWERSGILVAWMAPWFFMQFVAVPVSSALHVTGRIKTGMVLQILALVLRAGSVVLFYYVATRHISEAYAVSGAIAYLIHLTIIAKIVRLRFVALLRPFGMALSLAGAGAIAGWFSGTVLEAFFNWI